MIPLDDEILMRRADGELSTDEAARVDAAAAANPAVAARLAALRTTRTAVREAFPIATDFRDADLARRIRSTPARAPLAGLGAVLADAFAPRTAAIWGGLAATAFVAGLALAPMLDGRSAGLTLRSGGVVADAGLVRVLDRRLTADGPDAQGRAVGLTFQDADGRWCRTFSAGDAHLAGLACRDDGGWAVRVLALAPARSVSSDVRTAATELPASVLAAVDETIAGETLDAGAERIARDGGWPRRE